MLTGWRPSIVGKKINFMSYIFNTLFHMQYSFRNQVH